MHHEDTPSASCHTPAAGSCASGICPSIHQLHQANVALQFIYYLSSFFVQFGPNATTFLLAGEVFPTEARGLAHGISAAVGKVRSCFIQSWNQALAWHARAALLHVIRQRPSPACRQCWRQQGCKLDAWHDMHRHESQCRQGCLAPSDLTCLASASAQVLLWVLSAQQSALPQPLSH